MEQCLCDFDINSFLLYFIIFCNIFGGVYLDSISYFTGVSYHHYFVSPWIFFCHFELIYPCTSYNTAHKRYRSSSHFFFVNFIYYSPPPRLLLLWCRKDPCEMSAWHACKPWNHLSRKRIDLLLEGNRSFAQPINFMFIGRDRDTNSQNT